MAISQESIFSERERTECAAQGLRLFADAGVEARLSENGRVSVSLPSLRAWLSQNPDWKRRKQR